MQVRDTPAEPLPEGIQAEWDVPITMDDGAVLRADVFRPSDDAAYPVLLSHGPYAKGLHFEDGYPSAWRRMVEQHPDVEEGSSSELQSWEVADPEKWVPYGYCLVRVDSRGAGRSPGFLSPLSPRETRDLYECIEWAGTQRWSSGRVGLSGISYYAINQWQVAGMRPPHLAAIAPWEGSADFYRDMTHHGGILSTFWENWYDMQVKSVQHGVGPAGQRSRVTGAPVAGDQALRPDELEANRCDFGAEIAAHPMDDDYHKSRSADWTQIDIPLLSAANWGGQGLHPRGNFEGYMRAASTQKYLEVHGLEHWTHFYTDYGIDIQRRFFDRFLKDDKTGWVDQPPVQLQVRHVDGTFTQRGEDAWPIPRTAWTTLHLDATDSSLVGELPNRGSVEYEGLGAGVTFLSAPLEELTEVTGPLAAQLSVSSTTSDADLFLVVRVFDPAGKEVTFQGAIDPHTPVAQGWLRASHRELDPILSTPWRPYHTHRNRQPLTPGEIVEVAVEIWPTSLVIPAGYRLGLTVRGTDYRYEGRLDGERLSNFKNELTGCGPFLHDDPRDRPNEVFGGKVTVHTGGDHPSTLLIPVVPRQAS